MNLLTCLLTANDCYKTGQLLRPAPKGVMVHSTGANNPCLARYVQPINSTPNKDELFTLLGKNKNGNHWNRPGLNVCVHGFIGKLADGSIASVQTLPWNYRGWHAGNGTSGRSANDTHISFEICEDGLTDKNYFNKVYQEAVELTAMLCKEYNLDPLKDGVVICHSEGYRRGIASGHSDVEHWFPKHGKSMNDFRNDVKQFMTTPIPDPNPKEDENSMKYYKYYNDIPTYYQDAILKVMSVGALNGVGKDEDGNVILNVSEDFCRTMTVLNRLGLLD